MGNMKCPFCGQDIDSDSKRCFFCDSDLSHVHDHVKSNLILEHKDSNNTPKVKHPIGLTELTLILVLSGIFLVIAFVLIRYFN